MAVIADLEAQRSAEYRDRRNGAGPVRPLVPFRFAPLAPTVPVADRLVDEEDTAMGRIRRLGAAAAVVLAILAATAAPVGAQEWYEYEWFPLLRAAQDRAECRDLASWPYETYGFEGYSTKWQQGQCLPLYNHHPLGW